MKKTTLRAFGGPLPAASPSKVIDFSELEALRKHLATIIEHQVASLKRYHAEDTNGFYHRLDEQPSGKLSKASTATCVLSLIATDHWHSSEWSERTSELVTRIVGSDWKSADLPLNNVFTTAFVLEVAQALVPEGSDNAEVNARFDEADQILLDGLKDGYAAVGGYPPSAYVTQLVVRVLQKREKLDDATARRVQDEAWREIYRQLCLQAAESKSADPYQLAYSIIIASQLGDLGEATPDQALILQFALDKLFDVQLSDGSWPRSQPLFHYPSVGTAHCYEYEMLVQLLSPEAQLQDRLLTYLPKLSTAAYALSSSAYELGDKALGWSSGHHPQLRGPESWSTASVFHYAHALDRLLAEAVRRWIFDHLDAPYIPPRDAEPDANSFGREFLDSTVQVGAEQFSLRQTLFTSFVEPIARDAGRVRAGKSLSSVTPMSAIFFGPPGTSKTQLSELISEFIGWPLLKVDPSYFVRHGFDQVQAEASRLFGMLAVAEQLVVLLDEFDEMVRDRDTADDVLSRFLTTGMLPKLSTINENKRIVFIVATNYINNFDRAISRQGRFDLILQVLPPTADEKLRKWSGVREKLNAFGLLDKPVLRGHLADLTFLEFKSLAALIETAEAEADVRRLIEQAHERCTMNSNVSSGKNASSWRDASTQQQALNRRPLQRVRQ
jgi:hypothetical protein